jgi:hypothetical protein
MADCREAIGENGGMGWPWQITSVEDKFTLLHLKQQQDRDRC